MKSGCFRLAFLVVVLLSVASFRFNSNHRLSSSRIEMAHKDFAKLAIAASLLTSNPLVASAAIGPLGNLGAAFNAYKQNPDSVWCNLDNQSIKEGESSCQQLDNVVRYRAGKLITVRQDWGGSASTGSAIWNGANMATWFLENRIGADSVKGNSVLELGAGVGFTSLVANIMGAQDVVITDGNEDVLKLADMNILLNSDNSDAIGVEGIDGSPIRTIRTARLQWNTDDEKALSISESTKRPWDYIFASDLTYKKAAWVRNNDNDNDNDNDKSNPPSVISSI